MRPGADQSLMGARPPWWWRFRPWFIVVALSTVIGGVIRVGIDNAGPGSLVGWAELLITATPSLLAIVITFRWRTYLWECALAVAAWVPFLVSSFDLSCTDCAFALIWPWYFALPQLTLVGVGLLAPQMRRHGSG